MVFSAFLFEVVDASLGMGYGTILTPMLLMLGFDPLQVVPPVLVSQLAGDFLAAFFHHKFRNVNLSMGGRSMKVAVTLALLSLTGAVIAVIVAVNLPKLYLNLYIGSLVAVLGLVVLITYHKNYGFSWLRLSALGLLAAFNKGMSGGGYGPIVTSCQILVGVDARSAIGITSLAEGIVSVVSVLMYMFIGEGIDWRLAFPLTIGVALSTPVAAFIVSKVKSGKMRLTIGVFTLSLGLVTILKTLID